MHASNPSSSRSRSLPVFGRWLIPLVLILLLTVAAGAQQTVYVKVKDAKVRAGTSATAAVVATPATGAALTVLAVEGPRYKVRTADGKEGYISRLHVSDTKPSSGGGLLSGLGRSEVQANEAQTVASIRGLSPAAKQMAQQEGISAKAVQWAEKMETESAKVTKPQVESFLKAEGVGL